MVDSGGMPTQVHLPAPSPVPPLYDDVSKISFSVAGVSHQAEGTSRSPRRTRYTALRQKYKRARVDASDSTLLLGSMHCSCADSVLPSASKSSERQALKLGGSWDMAWP